MEKPLYRILDFAWKNLKEKKKKIQGVHLCLASSNRPRLLKFPPKNNNSLLKNGVVLLLLYFLFYLFISLLKKGGLKLPPPRPPPDPSPASSYGRQNMTLFWGEFYLTRLSESFRNLIVQSIISASSLNLFHFQSPLFFMLLGLSF